LHPSGHNGKSSGHYLEFVKILVFQCICLDDVIFRPDSQLSKHHPSGQREYSVRTFLCVENLRTVPTSIRLDAVIYKESRAFKVQPSG